MAILPIRRYPDPILRKRAALIPKITSEIHSLIDDMIETMYASPGTIGLAAPQIGKSLRLIVLDVTPKEKKNGLLVVVNPVLREKIGPRLFREGCLSLPDYTGNVMRFGRTVVQGQDRDGNVFELETSGIEAICFQHEIDHIEGVLFLDRVESLKTDIFRRKRYKSL